MPKHDCIIDLEACNEHIETLQELGPHLAERLKAIKGITTQLNKRLKKAKLKMAVWLEEPFKDHYVLGYRQIHGCGHCLAVSRGEQPFFDGDIEVQYWDSSIYQPLTRFCAPVQVLALRHVPKLLAAMVEQLESTQAALDDVLPSCDEDEPCPLCGNKG